MTTPVDRTLAVWRVEALAVLARAARARGIDGLARVIPFKRLLNVVGRLEVEQAMPGVREAPSDAEVDALMHKALTLLTEYPRLKALAQVGQTQLPLPGAPPPAAPPPPPPVPPQPPPVPHRMDHLADPLFAFNREIVEPRQVLRDLGSLQGLARIRERQEAALAAFFAPPAPAPGATLETEARAWSAHFELGETLEVVTSPLTGLPQFVKRLDVYAGHAGTTVLAANLRSGVSRTTVPVSMAPYTWSTGDFDEEVGDALNALKLPGFLEIRATAFRIGATGAGQRLDGAALSPGRAYRLLVPPGATPPALLSVEGEGGDWQIVELDLPSPVPAEVEARLLRLGLVVAKTGLDVELTGIAARAYRTGRGGERYACFRPDDRPVVRVAGADAKLPGERVVFLHGPDGQRRFELPPGREQFVALGPLAPGRYALDVLSIDPSHTPERLFFEIDAHAGHETSVARAQVVVLIGGERLTIDGDTSLELDLAELDPANLRIAAPPLWRMGARWEGARSRPLPPLHADAEGDVPAETLVALTEHERTTEALGDLVLDFGDFGRLSLQHTRDPAPDEVGDRLRALWLERGAAVEAERDAALLRMIWLEPVCLALGYAVREVAPLADGGATVLAAFGLETTTRDGGRIATEQHAALLVVRRGADLRAGGAGSAREAASKLAKRGGHARVVMTDGLAWALWERGRTFAAAPLEVGEALGGEGEGAEARAEEMVGRFHA